MKYNEDFTDREKYLALQVALCLIESSVVGGVIGFIMVSVGFFGSYGTWLQAGAILCLIAMVMFQGGRFIKHRIILEDE